VRVPAAILLALLVLVAAAPTAASARPRLHVLSGAGSGLGIGGRGFKPLERVRVKASLGYKTVSKRVRAGMHGRFKVRLPLAFGLGCGVGYLITARGSLGSRASLRLGPLPCPIEG
jgi:hypothetical protein